MKKLLTITLLFFFVTSIQAQDINKSTKDGFISISLGLAIPTGDFADDDPGNNDAGFAENGASFNLINFGYLFSKNVGITAMLQGSGFPFDNGGGANDPTWGYGTFLVGPLFTIRNENSDAEFDFRVMFGSMSGILDLDDGSEEIEGSGGALALGAGLRYNISDVIAFTTNLDFIGGKPEFDTPGGTAEQSMSSANLTVGIAFRLN